MAQYPFLPQELRVFSPCGQLANGSMGDGNHLSFIHLHQPSLSRRRRDAVGLHVLSQTASHKQTWTTRAVVKRIWKAKEEEERRRKADLKFLSRLSLTFSRDGREKGRERASAFCRLNQKMGLGRKCVFLPSFPWEF